MGRFVFAALAIALGSSPALAQVGLKKPSDIVHAFVQDGQACPGFPASEDRFSHRVLPDGTLPELVVPPKQVLIVRRVALGTSGNASGLIGLVTILGGPPGNPVGYATRRIVLEADGSGRLEIEFPIGFAVPAGGVICISNTMGIEFGGSLEGYFAKAK